MVSEGELAPIWRLLLALAIVLGIVGFGFFLIYAWILVVPVILVATGVVVGARWVFRG